MSVIKGVVLEKNKNHTIILTDDGQFKKIVVKGNFELGDEVLGKEFKSRKGLYQRMIGGVAIAAALLIAILLPGLLTEDKITPNNIIASSDTIEETVVAYVQVDINPSLKLGLNEESIVIEATPLNADGEQILAQGDLTGISVSSAMELVTEMCYKLGYLKVDKENIVNLTYIPKETNSSKIDKGKLEQDIKDKVQKVMDKKNIKGEVKEFKENETNPNSNQNSKQVKELKKENSETEKKSVDDSQTTSETKVQKNSGNSNKLKIDNESKDKLNNKSKANGKDRDKSNDKNYSDHKDTQENNENKGNKNLNDKTKENSSNNGVVIKSPWYKIFELG